MQKTIVITGSTSGLGKAAALSCLKNGASVVVSSENPEALSDTLQAFSDYRNQVSGLVCDVTQLEHVKKLSSHAVQHFGRIDCWINNAGTTAPSGDTASAPSHFGNLVINTNILGTYNGSIMAIRQMRKQGFGKLINITGRGEKGPQAGANLYASAKSWVRNFSLALTKEEKSNKIEVGTFNPGLILTALTHRPRILKGGEVATLKGLKMVMPIIGNTPEKAAHKLMQLACGEVKLARENRASAFLPSVLKRLITGQRANIDVDTIEPILIEPELE